LLILLIWEVTIWLQGILKGKVNHQKLLASLNFSFFLMILMLFFIFHEYTLNQEPGFPDTFEILNILERNILDIASYGLIPWIAFPIFGAFTASFLCLPCVEKHNISKKMVSLLILDALFTIIGLMYLTKERVVAPAIVLPSSYPHVFLSIGLIGSITIIMIALLDYYEKLPRESITRFFYPIITLSKITLTVYFFHPVIGFLDPEIITSETMLLVVSALYSAFFVLIALVWQKWKFKYSLEWLIRKVTKV
ncbi:MAG: hypothetical protein ACXAEU_04620, partial [Candidatus Hodarchaeales archaeon]